MFMQIREICEKFQIVKWFCAQVKQVFSTVP